MPTSRKRRDVWDEDDDNEEEEVVTKKAKKVKKAKKSAATVSDSEANVTKDSEGNHYWELAGKKRVVISEFKGQRMVSIREYYEKDGQALPGKKGITLPVSHFSALISLLPEIESVLRSKGEDVPRPDYSNLSRAEADQAEDESIVSGGKETKRNFEETSDEE